MKPLAEHVRETPFVICAHRGASGEAPENTLIALRNAVEAGAEMVELDIQATRDGHLVVIHDDDVDRTTNGTGSVNTYSLAELQQLDAGSWFDPQFSNQRIPSLNEALDVVQGKAYLNVEIKPMIATAAGAALLAHIVDVIDKRGLAPYTVFSSFDHAALLYLKSINSQMHTNALHVPGDRRLPSDVVSACRADGYGCAVDEVNVDVISNAHQHFIPVGVYTVNTPEVLFAMLDLGVNGVVTNFPLAMKQALFEWKAQQS